MDQPHSLKYRVVFWLVDGAANLGAPPPDTFWTRVVGGWLGPLLVGALGAYCVVRQRIVFRADYAFWEKIPITGPAAVAAGLGLISIAIFAHFYCFWSRRHLFAASIGMLVSGLATGVSLLAFIWLAMSR
ncbi:MAG: hypothetical protein V1873_03975 [Verrucomicrobiota bacterium]